MRTLVRPEFLKPGDTVGIVSTARQVSESDIATFQSMMEKEGYNVKCAKHLYGQNNQFSGTIEQRISDLHDMIKDPVIRVIFSARGGYGTAQLLPYLDRNLIRKYPKWIIGFSDITILHSAMNKYMETIHGVMPYSFSMKIPQSDASFHYLLQLLKGEEVSYNIPYQSLNIPGSVRTEIIGGNLSVLYSMAGSVFEPDYEGKILFLEDLDEYLYHVDRMIMNFELRNIFQKIEGLIVGDFSDMHDNDTPFGKDAIQIIADRAHKYGIPTIFGFPAGHKKNNFPLIFGRISTLTIQEGNNTLVMY